MSTIPVAPDSNRGPKPVRPADRPAPPQAPKVERPVTVRKTPAPPAHERLRSLDAYRGFIMLAMASAGLGLAKVFDDPKYGFWHQAALQMQHVPWIGGVFWDMIQPAFMFMVGVALPFSNAKRIDEGQSFAWRLFHAVIRSIVLVALGVFLYSKGQSQTNFVFTNVLAQIGLGYTFVFLLAGRGYVLQFLAFLAILGGTFAAFHFHTVKPHDEPYVDPGVDMVPKALADESLTKWRPHENFAAELDRWFLNLFPRAERHVTQRGGYQTFNFVPSIATMILGLMVGGMLRGNLGKWSKLAILVMAGGVCVAAAFALDGSFGGAMLVPIVKRIWTPSWVLYSGGWVMWMLAGFYLVIDVLGLRAWSLPFIVVGMNSIAMYLMSQLMTPFIVSTIKTHFGQNVFDVTIGDLNYAPIIQACSVLLVLWLICFYLFKQKAFLRI